MNDAKSRYEAANQAFMEVYRGLNDYVEKALSEPPSGGAVEAAANLAAQLGLGVEAGPITRDYVAAAIAAMQSAGGD